MDFFKIIKKMFRRVRITKAGDDSKQFPVQQVSFNNKLADAFMLFPYGLHGNCPPDSMGVMFAIGADDSNRVVIAGTPNNRPQMKEGEVCLYHPPTGTMLHFNENGDILMTTGTQVIVDSPDVQFTGNIQINGNLTVDGDTALSSNVTSGGKDISDTHTHVGSPTAPTGGISPTGVPN